MLLNKTKKHNKETILRLTLERVIKMTIDLKEVLDQCTCFLKIINEKRLSFVGHLALYKYFNMYKAVLNALGTITLDFYARKPDGSFILF